MVNVLPWVTPLIKPNTLDHISWTRPPRNHFAVSTVEKHLLKKIRLSNKFRPYSITIYPYSSLKNSNNLLLQTLSLIGDGSRISVQKYFIILSSACRFIQACQTTFNFYFFLNHLYWPKMSLLSTLNRLEQNNLVPNQREPKGREVKYFYRNVNYHWRKTTNAKNNLITLNSRWIIQFRITDKMFSLCSF